MGDVAPQLPNVLYIDELPAHFFNFELRLFHLHRFMLCLDKIKVVCVGDFIVYVVIDPALHEKSEVVFPALTLYE